MPSATSTTNTLILGGDANDSLDVSSIGSTAQYRNFNIFEKTGTSTWALTGTATAATPWTIEQGTRQIGNGGTSGSVIGNIADDAALAFDRSDVFTFGNVVSDTGMVNQVGTGTTVLTAANTYRGGTNVMAGTLAVGDAADTNATIGTGLTSAAAGATLGGYGMALGSGNSSGTIAAANTLASLASGNTGTFSLGGNLDNAGVVNLAAASGQIGNVLKVAGNYTGSNGQLVLNRLLNTGGATSQSDQLAVGGNVSGNTVIKLNQSGTGAATVGDGIELVQVTATSAANSFRLSGPVQAGAYEYLLYQGGAADANDWYLRSELEAPSSPASGAATATSPASGTTPARSSANSVTPAAATAYRPAAVGYSVTPLHIADYGFTVLGQLHERIGAVENAQPGQPVQNNGVWGVLEDRISMRTPAKGSLPTKARFSHSSEKTGRFRAALTVQARMRAQS